MNNNQTAGTDGGVHISNTPLTTQNISEASPELLRNSIDERIVKIRPMSTPIDQLSRCGNSRHAGSMTVEYYSVDTKQTSAQLTEAAAGGTGRQRSDNMWCHTIKTSADNIFDVSETLLVPSVNGYDASGKVAGPLVLYILSKPESGGIEVAPVNGKPGSTLGEETFEMPAIPKGAEIVRMGRAASELDVQSPQFSALPRKASNNCQIFKMQVEQSTLARIADKEVGWNFSDQEEAAIIDMRLGMEKNFIFGSRAKLFDPEKNEHIYFTGGIWGQTNREYLMTRSEVDEKKLVDLCREAFTGNNGSKRKLLLAGSKLMQALSQLEYSKVVSAGETKVKWGIEFKEISSNFGTLYILHSEVFDQCGHENDGFIIDPDYMTKYVHVPFQAENLDLRKSGQRNTDAVVLTEASCLVLRYPNAHMKVIMLED